MTVAIIQARMSSSRLPGKVMKPLLGQPMIGRQIERLQRARRLSRIIVATSTDPLDDLLADYVRTLGVGLYRGDLDDVLGRFMGALNSAGRPDTFLRLTADCPLADPDVVDQCIAHHLAGGYDYTHNSPGWTFPKGLDVEVCQITALEAAFNTAHDPYEREHVTPYIYRHPEQFRIGEVRRDPPLRWRWTVDVPADFAFVTAVYEGLYPQKPDFRLDDISAWQVKHPDLALPHDPDAPAPR